MAKLTDRYENQNLVSIAKQQYETKQQNTIPAEIVSLTSEGKIYPKSSPLRSGKLEMRYMTAYDEDILTNASYLREGVVLEKLVQALIISDVDYNEISSVDKDGLILSARILSYGSQYPVTVTDPKTKKELSRTVDLSKLHTKTIDLIPDENGEFDFKVNKHTLKFKFTTNLEYKESTTVSEFLKATITEVNRSRKQDDIEHFIQYEFLAIDSRRFQAYIVENTPTILLEYEFEGDEGGTFTAGFPVGRDLFWF